MFRKRLRAARMARNLTQQNMADSLSLSLNAYQKYEQGERFPSMDVLIKLADVLDISIDWLFGRDDYLKSHGVHVDEYL